MRTSPMFSLYDLLPAMYRIDDEKTGGALCALLTLIEAQAGGLKKNIDELYDDFFIETCAEWVIPYIGELVGNNPLPEVLQTRRADVAHTLYYRRRKGTLTMLEELARDVTGWSVHVVPFFELLVWSQNMNHVRQAGGTAQVRSLETMDRFGTPFDSTAHTLDIRLIDRGQGWYHQRHAGFFCWRLFNYHVEGGRARQEGVPFGHGFHFSPIGISAPLFHRLEYLPPGQAAGQQHVRAAIRQTAFHADRAAFYDPTITPSISRDGASIAAVDIVFMDLSAWAQPAPGKVGVDARRGRISFPAGEEPAAGAAVSYAGGPYIGAVQQTAPNDHSYQFALLGLAVSHDSALVPVDQFAYMDLSAWAQPNPGSVGVDLGLGRLSFAPGQLPGTDVQVRFGSGNFIFAIQAIAPNQHGYVFPLPVNMRSLRIATDGAPVPVDQLFCLNLENWTRPDAGKVGVDVVRGRVSFAAGEEPTTAVTVSYDYGFAAALGGGPYDRTAPVRPGTTTVSDAVESLERPQGNLIRVGASGLNTIDEALAQWRNGGRQETVIQIDDSRTYAENLLLDGLQSSLVIQAANMQRPVIAGSVLTNGGNGTGSLLLSGLLVTGSLRAEGDLKTLTISHATIQPGQATASVVVLSSNQSIQLLIERSITGGIALPPESALEVSDSIIDSTGVAIAGQTVATIQCVTVWGDVQVGELSLASECIFVDRVEAERRQSGCVRFSYLPEESQTPRRYRCQPESAIQEVPDPEKPIIRARLLPVFTSRRYGQPGYVQLHLDCPMEISAGGEDGGEMGALQFLQQGRRHDSLRMRLEEYLPFGIEAGILYAN